MVKRAFLLAVGFWGFSFCLLAQQTSQTGSRDIAVFNPALALSLYQPGISRAMDSSVLIPYRPELTLLAGSNLLAEMGMAPLDFFPVASADVSPESKTTSASVRRSARKNSGNGTDGKESPANLVYLPSSPIYYGGEVGIFYGRWNGKYGGDIMQTYILGDIGNEKFHIRVGAAYGESNVNVPKFRSSKR